jgi:hypothetical protein
MSKTIIVRLKKVSNRLDTFSITDSLGNVLDTSVSKPELIAGVTYTVDDNVFYVLIKSIGKNCCTSTFKIVLSTITNQEVADFVTIKSNTASLWSHLKDQTIYNSFYGCIAPYTIEYPVAYQFNDQIAQNVKDYSKVYAYLPSVNGSFDVNRKVQTDDFYFNKALVYNDQQCSGELFLNKKPTNNLKGYMSYPKYYSNGKDITFTKSDNFYQFNTFWSILKDKYTPMFTSSCVSMSYDKELNQSNMDYSTRTFHKAPLRAKDLRVRLTLDDRTDIHIVSQLFTTNSQISYK